MQMVMKTVQTTSGVCRKFPRGAKFRHNRVTSQINFRGSAEGTTFLGSPGDAPGKILQNYASKYAFLEASFSILLSRDSLAVETENRTFVV